MEHPIHSSSMNPGLGASVNHPQREASQGSQGSETSGKELGFVLCVSQSLTLAQASVTLTKLWTVSSFPRPLCRNWI